jgi:Fe2+ or Zn2+ uptake regulation protein
LPKAAKKPVPLEKLLRDRGARVTPQRVAILEAVGTAGSHPDAEVIYRYVSRRKGERR